MSRLFYAVGDNIDLGSGFGTGEALTILAWVRNDAIDATTRYLFCHDPTTSNTGHYAVFKNTSDTISFRMRGQTVTGTTVLVPGRWYFVVAVGIQNAGTRIYINGELEATNGTDNAIVNGAAATTIGAQNNTGSNRWNGAISQVGLYRSRTLSQTEIIQAMWESMSIMRSISGFWPLIGSDPEPDISGNNLNGTVSGTTYCQDEPPTFFKRFRYQPALARYPAVRNRFMHDAFILAKAPAGGTAHTKELTETVTLSDAAPKQTNRLLSETLTLTDTKIASLSRQLLEALSLSDTQIKAPAKTLSETLSLADTLLKDLQRTLSESVTLTDVNTNLATKIIELTEILTLSDTLTKLSSKLLSENLTLSDTFVKGFVITLSEILTLVDTVTTSLSQTIVAQIEARVIQKVIAALKDVSTVTGYVGTGSSARIYPYKPATIQDFQLPAISLRFLDSQGRLPSAAYLEPLDLEIGVWMNAFGQHGRTWDDVMDCFEAILNALHRTGVWDNSIGIKIYEMTNISDGPQTEDGGVLFYPSRWRVLATV